MHLAESPVKAKLAGTCSAGTGPDLTGYPHLVYAPAQWGQGVCVARNGRMVQEIAEWADGASDDRTTVWSIDETSKRFDITWEELFDALRYARANGLI